MGACCVGLLGLKVQVLAGFWGRSKTLKSFIVGKRHGNTKRTGKREHQWASVWVFQHRFLGIRLNNLEFIKRIIHNTRSNQITLAMVSLWGGNWLYMMTIGESDSVALLRVLVRHFNEGNLPADVNSGFAMFLLMRTTAVPNRPHCTWDSFNLLFWWSRTSYDLETPFALLHTISGVGTEWNLPLLRFHV